MQKYTDNSEKEFKAFWDKMAHPSHAHSSAEWFEKYYEEWKFLLKNRRHIVDAGCGSGEFIKLMQNDFSFIYGIDYSESMLQQAERSLTPDELKKVKLFHGSINDIKRFLDGSMVDSIISNQVIQYLTYENALDFIKDSISCLNPGGELIIMNIPNLNMRELFNIKLYKRRDQITYKTLVKEILHFHWSVFKQKLKNRNYKFSDGIGNWFLMSDFESWASKLDAKIEFFYSMYVPYGYRFHVRITK